MKDVVTITVIEYAPKNRVGRLDIPAHLSGEKIDSCINEHWNEIKFRDEDCGTI